MEDMLEIPEIDVAKVMEQIRENVRKRRQEFPPSNAASPPPTDQVLVDLTSLHRGYDIYPTRFISHRRVLGRFVVLAKKMLQKLLTPILERQVAYNAANTRVTAYLREQVETLRQQQATALQALQQTVTEQMEELGQQQATALQALQQTVTEQMEELGQQQADALQALRVEMGAQVAAVQQQQAALHAEVAALGQRQTDALQALRVEMGAQVAAVQQQQAALHAEVAALGQRQTDALQALRVEMGAQVAAVQQQQAALHAEVAALGQRQTDALQVDAFQALRVEIERASTEREARVVEWERTVLRLKTEVILQERRITMLLEEARKRLPDSWDQEQLQTVADEAHHVLDALYVSFEDQFRGTREDIKERLRMYIPIVQEAKLGSETTPILDVGCGRGEWLELLQEEGLCGQGVDQNRILVEQCRRRGLGVVESDALTYLRSLPDASLGTVTGFHIIEHLPLERLVELLDETVRVLTSGGLAIFETPNPQNVLVGSHHFYLDPTHRNPLPSSMMKFMVEARGLCRVEIIELHPYPAAYRVQEAGLDVAQRFNEYFYGAQDYAVVGWKV